MSATAPLLGVQPTLSELIGLRALQPVVQRRRRVRQGEQGWVVSQQRGRGMEYAESREYAAGDDVRHIDWRLTARTGRAHTKLFQAEREQTTLLVADTAPALYFGTRARFKSVQAARAGAVAAWHAVRQGDRVAAVRGSQSEPPVRPGAGDRGALHVLHALCRWYSQPPAEDAGLDVALEHAQRLAKPGSRVIVLADPVSVAAIADTRWTELANRRELVVLLLTDALEMQPPKAPLPFALASGAQMVLEMDDNSVRQRWEALITAPAEKEVERLQRKGIAATTLMTEAASDAWTGLLARAVARVA